MPVPQKVNLLVELASCQLPNETQNEAQGCLRRWILRNGQDARSTKSKSSSGTGILPVTKHKN